MTDDRYDRVTFRGQTVNKWTREALLAVEADLGYELTLYQGSYHQGVGASAGTHDGGGAVDLSPWHWQEKLLAMRRHGFAAWHRLPSQGPWVEHIHAILIGDTDASPAAQQQVVAYRNGLNGLVGNARDDGPRVPIKPFDYNPGGLDMPLTDAEIDKIAARVWAYGIPSQNADANKGTKYPASSFLAVTNSKVWDIVRNLIPKK